jgi:hypothetical protein
LDSQANENLPEPTPGDGPGLRRSARLLLGWMPEAQGAMLLAGNFSGIPAPLVPENLERARQAREAVAARQPGIDQEDLAFDPPSELDDHIARLRNSPAGAAMLQAGWRVAIVDLGRICAFQPLVHTDTTAERVEGVKADDLSSIANITLPTESAEPPQVGFDQGRQAFTVLSPNPNLKIVGNFRSPVPDAQGALGLGFLVRVMPSFVQVIQFQGRYLLHDGYHRAHGLLGRGISNAPVFLRTMNAIEEFALPGMLPQGAYLGDRPPVLLDYHDEQVACQVRAPAVQRMIVIQGIELNPGG